MFALPATVEGFDRADVDVPDVEVLHATPQVEDLLEAESRPGYGQREPDPCHCSQASRLN